MKNNIYTNPQRKYFFTLLIMLMSMTAVMFSTKSFAQPAGFYTFATDTSGNLSFDKDGNAIDMTTGSILVYGPNADVYTASVLNIGFTFFFSGTNYTQFSVNPDGQLRLGSTAITDHTQAPALNTSKIIVMNTDNKTGATGQVTAKTQAGTLGQVLIIEWKDVLMPWNAAGSTLSTFQLRLYETTGEVEMVYGQMWNSATSSLSGSVGISSSNIATSIGVVTNLITSMVFNGFATAYTTTAFPASSAIANLKANSDTTCRRFTFNLPPPCTAPTDQPNALVLTAVPFTSTSITGTFNPASSNPHGYLVVRYPSGAAITDPVDGTAYVAGNALGLGTVVAAGTLAQTTPFTSTGLTFNTSYDFVIYSANFICTGGPPFYQVLNPLIGTGTTNGNTLPSCNTTFGPVSGAINQALTTTLSWSGAIGSPAPYAFDVYMDTSFAAVAGLFPSAKVGNALVTSPFTPQTYLGRTLAPGTTYYWTIISINSVGNSAGCVVNSFTTIIPTNRTATIGGLWNDVNTWGGTIPVTGDNVTIPYGVTVTANVAATLSSLTIKGKLDWAATTAALTVVGNVLVDTGGVLLPYLAAATPTGQTLNIGGNFINNGYVDFSLGVGTVTPLLNMNGSQQGGGSLNQIVGGTGNYEGTANYGIIRALNTQTIGTVTISASDSLNVYALQQNAGTLVTNDKLAVDNTIETFGMARHNGIISATITAMGSAYGASAPVIAPSGAVNWAASPATGAVGSIRVSGVNVYVVTIAGTFGATAPTHTSGSAANGGTTLLWVGNTGTIGTPFAGTSATLTPTVGTSYFYANQLFTCLSATAMAAATVNLPATSTALAATTIGNTVTISGSIFLCVGNPATLSLTYDATTQTVRRVNVTNYGSGYRAQLTASQGFSILTTTATGSGATGFAVYVQGSTGPGTSTFIKGNTGVITGTIKINSTQNQPQFTGIGGLSASDRGRNYTVAPLVGFTGPTAINLITDPGTLYAAAPTITVTAAANTLVAGTALTSANFTITVNKGKVVSVYLNTATSAAYTVAPTLTMSAPGGGGTTALLSFPAGSWPTATATIDADRQLSFAMTNPGYGYNVTPTCAVGTTSPSVTGGTFTTVASTFTPRLALYNLTYNYLAPALANAMNNEGAEVPANRKINILIMSSPGVGAKFNSNLELFGTAPLTLTYGLINMRGNNILFSNSAYTGTATTTTLTCIDSASISLTTKGGNTGGQTLNFPFDAAVSLITGTGTVASGSDVLRFTASRGAKPTGTAVNAPIGSRTTSLVFDPPSATLGLARRITLNFNGKDSIPPLTETRSLVIGEATATTGPWATISDTSTGTALLLSIGLRQSTLTATFDMDSLSGRYYGWVSNDTVPNITGISPGTYCNGGGQTATIAGIGFRDLTAVQFNGVNATSFSVNTTFDTIIAVTPSGISAGNIVIYAAGTTDTSTAYTVTNTGTLSATIIPSNSLICSIGDSVSISLTDIGADSYSWSGPTGLNTYTGLNVIASPVTSSQYTVSAVFGGFGCTVTKKFNIGVIETLAPTATATPANSCFGSSTSVALNSNIIAGNFAVSSIAYIPPVLPSDSVTSVDTVYKVTTRIPYTLGGTLDDGGWSNIPIGFDFNYFGNSYSTLSAGTNGVLMFGTVPGYGTATGQLGQFTFVATNGKIFPGPLNPANIIAPMASDHFFNASNGTLRYWTEGVAPTRRFIIQYFDVSHQTATIRSSFHAILYETTGVVDVHVLNTTATAAKTIGLQDATKTIGATAPGREASASTISIPEGWRFIPPAVYGFQWSPSTNLSSTTSSAPTYTITAAGTYNYTVTVTNPITGCSVQKPVSFTVNPTPPAPTVTGTTTICGSGITALFSNLPAAGNTIKWYNDPLSGVLVNSGNLYVTPTLSRDTTFYVTEQTALCSSPRVAVPITISTPPSFIVSDTTVCRGVASVEIKVNSDTTSYDTYIWSPITNLYQDAGLTTSYSGQSLTRVYAKLTGLDSARYICNSYSFTTLCATQDTALIRIQPATASISSSPSFICRSGSAILTLTTSSIVGPNTITWQKSTDGITYTDTIALTSAKTFTTPVLNDTMYYRVLIYNEAGTVCLTIDYQLNVYDPLVTGSSSTPICGTGSSVLTGNGTAGTTLNWYTTSTGGAPIGNGSPFNSPVINITTNFYLTASISTCESVNPRTLVTATVNNAIVLNATRTVCNDEIVTVNVTSDTLNYDTFIWSPLTNLFTDPAGTIAYTGTSATTLYARTNVSGTYIYACTATDTVASCFNISRDTINVHRSSGTLLASVTNICSSGSTTLRVRPFSATNSGFVTWQKSNDNITFTDTVVAGDSILVTSVLNSTRYYRAIVKNSAGGTCFTTDTATIFVNPSITATNTPVTRCGAGLVSLTASGTGDTLKWFKTDVSTAILAYGSPYTPFVTGNDSFYVAASRGTCTGTRTKVNVIVTAPPTFTISGSKQVVCNNSITQIRVTSTLADFDSYIWTPDTNLFLDSAATIPYNGTNEDTVYAVTGSDTGIFIYTVNASNSITPFCGAQKKDTLIVQPSSAHLTATTTTLCRKGRTTISVNPSHPFGAASLQWQKSTNNITFTDIAGADSVTSYLTDTLRSDTTYYFRARIRNSLLADCFLSDTIAIVVSNPQVATVTPDTICGSGIALLSATSASDTIKWYSVDTLGTALATSFSYSPNLTVTDTFFVASVENGCEGSRTPVIATVSSPLPLTLNPTRVVCNSEVVILSVTSTTSNFDSYTWSPTSNLFLNQATTIPYLGQNTDTVYLKKSAPGRFIYTCNATNSSTQCFNSKNDTIDVQLALVSITANPVRICASGTSTLTLSPTSPYGAGTIQWQESSDSINYTNIPSATSVSYTTPANTSTKYYRVFIKNTAGDTCLKSTPYKLVYSNPQVFSTTNGSRCGTGTVQLSATGSPSSILKWYTGPSGGSAFASGTTPATITSTSVSSQTIFYVADSLNGCLSATRMRDTAFVNTPPAFAITPPVTVCNNEITRLSVITNSSDYDVYIWSPSGGLFIDSLATIAYTGQNTDTVYARKSTPGNTAYSCNAVDTIGSCTALTSTTLTVQPASATISSVPTSICISGTAVLSLTPSSPYAPGSLQWQRSTDNINYVDIPAAISTTYTTTVLSQTRYYRALIKNGANNICYTTATDTLKVINPQVTSTTPLSRCGIGSVTLMATHNTDAVLNWFAAATGGTSLFLGDNFTTPVISTTTTYYVGASIGTCIDGRTAVIATISSPDTLILSAPQVVCNNGIALLTVTSDTASFDTHSWTPTANLYQDAAATVPYTGQNLDTVYAKTITAGSVTYRDTAFNSVSSCRNTATTTVFTQRDSAGVIVSPSDVCVVGDVTLTMSPATLYGTNSTQWQSSTNNITFNDISGALSNPYVDTSVSSLTYYRAEVKNSSGAVCFTTGSDTARVSSPALASTTGDTICGFGTATLNATPSGSETIFWYAGQVGGVPLDTGNTFTTPAINTTTTYYVAASNGGASVNVGMPNALSTATAGFGTTNFGLVFDALTSFTLQTVKVFPINASSASGTVTIDVINSAGTVVHTATVPITSTPTGFPGQVVTLNFNIAAGTNYKIRPGSYTGGITSLLFEPSAGAPSGNYGYPFVVPGVLSINTSTLTAAPTNTARNDLYYYFYDWVIGSGCQTGRVPVTAVVNTAPALTLSSDQTLCHDSIATISVTSNTANYTSYVWSPAATLYTNAAATIPYTGQNLTTVYAKASTGGTTTYTVTANDSVANCNNIATTHVTVVSVPIDSVFGSPNPACEGDTITLTAYTGTFSQVLSTVGTGTVVNTTTDVTIMPPYGNWYSGNRHQILYTAAELNSLGIVGGNINSIAFDVVSNTNALGYKDFTILIGETPAAALTTTFLTVPMTQVYTIGNYNPVPGWNTHTFSTPFVWNGTSNIVVETNFSNCLNCTGGTTCGTTGSGITYTQDAIVNQTVTGFVCHSFYYSDGASCNITTVTTASATTSTRPNTRFSATSGSIGAGNLVWEWNPGSLAGNVVDVTPSVTTMYYVSATDTVSGCTSIDSVLVEVIPIPDAPVGTNSLQCGYGVPGISMASSGGFLHWYLTPTGGTPIPNDSSASLENYAISSTTTFYVSEFDGTCESIRDTVVAVVTQPDSISATSSTLNGCENAAITLTATKIGSSNTYTYVWTASPSAGSGIDTSVSGPVVVVSPTIVGTYTYSVVGTDTAANPDCSYLSTVTVTVSESPIITITSDTIICPNSDFQLEVSQANGAGRAYSFNGTNQYIAIPQSPSLDLTSTAGNSITLEAWVIETAYPTLSPGDAGIISHYQTSAAASYFLRTNATSPYSGLGAGGSVEARVTPNGSMPLGVWTHVAAVFKYNPSTANDSVFIYKNGVAQTGTGTFVSVIPHTNDSLRIASDFSARYFNGVFDEVRIWNTNLSQATLQTWSSKGVSASHPNFANLVAYYNFNTLSSTTVTDISGNGNTGYLRNGPTQIASTVPISNVTYSWSPSAGLSNSTISNPVATVDSLTTYTVTVTAPNGCTATASVTIDVYATSPAPSTTNSTQCGIGVPGVSVSGSGGSFEWFLTPTGGVAIPGEIGDTLAAYVIDTTTIFYVGEFDGLCSGPRTPDTAFVTEPDQLSVTASDDSSCVNAPITLVASQIGGTNSYTYSWSSSPASGSGLAGNETNDTITVTPTLFGTRTYTVTGTDTTLGCVTQGIRSLYVIAGPTVPVPTANPTAVCPGGSSQLNAGAFSSGGGNLVTPNAVSTNGSSVIAFDMKNTSAVPVTTHFFSVGLAVAAGTSVTENIWYIPSSMACVFPTTTPGPGWILIGTVNVTSAGLATAGVRTVIPLDVNITIPPGQTYAFAIGGASISYRDGVGGCPVVASDAYLTVYEGYGGAVSPGTTIADRVWTGDVTYTFLTGDPNLRYVWSPGATLNNDTIANPIATPITTTIYTVIAINPTTGCFSSGSVQVTVNTAAGSLAFTTNPNTVCNKGPVVLSIDTPVVGVTYNWQRSSTGLAGSWTNIGSGAIKVSDSISTNTYFRVYSSCGLVGDTSISKLVTIINPNVASISTPSRCGPGPVTLSATGTGTFNWYANQTGGTALATDTSVFNTLAPSTTTYWVEAHIGSCYDPRVPALVTIFTSPVASVTVSPNDTVCRGSSVTFTASSPIDPAYTYYWSTNLVSALDTSVSYTFTADSSRTYYLYAVDSVAGPNYGCAYLVTLPITVISSPPTPVISPDPAVICSIGGCVDLSVTGGVASAPGIVTVGTGTVQNTTTDITIMPPYGNWYTGNRHQILFTAAELNGLGMVAGNITSLAFDVLSNANALGYIDFTIRLGHTSATALTATFETTPTTQVYTTPNYNPVPGWNSHVFSTPFNWDGTSNLLVETYFSDCLTCTGGTTCATTGSGITYTQNAITNQTVQSFVCHSFYFSDGAGCNPNTVTTANATPTTTRPNIQFNAITGSPITYTWNPGAYVGVNYIVCPTADSTFTVTASLTNGCTNTDTITVIYDPITLPTITSSGDTTICQGTSDTLDAGSGYAVYTWTAGTDTVGTGQSLIVSPSSTTTYTVTVSSASGCTASASQMIAVDQINAPTIDPAGTAAFCSGDSIELNAGIGYVTYSWSDGNSVVGTDSAYTASNSGTYTVTVTVANGCSASDNIVVTENPLPPTANITPAGSIDICNDTGLVTLYADTTGAGPGSSILWNNVDGGFYDSLVVEGSFIDFILGGGQYLANFTVTNAFGCSSTSSDDTINAISCATAVTLNIKMMIEGFYTSNGHMNNFGLGGCLYLYGASPDTGDVDTVIVSAMDPVTKVLVDSAVGVLRTNGSVGVTFDASVISGNSYYIKVNHRNTVEAWSAAPVVFVASTPSSPAYDFTTSQSKTFGNNMIDVGYNWSEPPIWAFYSGDIFDAGYALGGITGQQDGIVESSDYSEMENAAYSTLSGYVFADITGDLVTESTDYSIMENNAYFTIFVIVP